MLIVLHKSILWLDKSNILLCVLCVCGSVSVTVDRQVRASLLLNSAFVAIVELPMQTVA